MIKRICQQLKELRIESGLTHYAISKKLGTLANQIAKIENGQVIPRLDSVVKLAHIYGYELQLVKSLEVERTNKLEEKIQKMIAELNEESSTKWEDERFIALNNFTAGEFTYIFDLQVGKYETSFFTIKATEEGWLITDSYDTTKKAELILEQVMTYCIMPILFEKNKKKWSKIL